MKRTVLLLTLLALAVAVQAQVTLLPVPKTQFLDANGDPLASGKVFTYISGTTTNQATFTDSGGGTPNANPVILDSAGRANIWLTDGLAYTIVLKTSADVQQWSVDGVISGDLETALVIGTTAVTFSSTPTFDSSTASYFSITLTGNVTSSTISNASDGRIIYFNICQDSTGSRTFTWPASVLTAPTVGPGPSVCTSVSFIYDGTNWRELAAPSQGSGTIFDGRGHRYATIQDAIDEQPATGGKVLLAEGNINITATLTVTGHNISLIGRGPGGTTGSALKAGGSTITWTGSAGGTMIRWGNQADHILGGGIDGVELNGGALATKILHITDAQHFDFENLYLRNPRANSGDEAITLDNNSAAANPTGEGGFKNVSVDVGGSSGDARCVNIAGTSGTGVFGITWDNFRCIHYDGTGVLVTLGDGMLWLNPQIFRGAGGSGQGFDVRPANASDPVSGHVLINPQFTAGLRIETTGSASLDTTTQITALHYGTTDTLDPLGAGATVNLMAWMDDGRYVGRDLTMSAAGLEVDGAGTLAVTGSGAFDRTGTGASNFGSSGLVNFTGANLRIQNGVLLLGYSDAASTETFRWDAASGAINPQEGTTSNVPRWIFKQVDHTDMTAAATADTFTLWTLPANTMIHDVVGTVVTAWEAAVGLSAAVCSVGTAAGSANDLTLDDDFFAIATVYELHDATASGGKGGKLFDSTDKFAPHMLVASGDIEIQCDLTGDDHADTNAGQARIYILVSQPLGNTATEAN